MSSVKVKVTVGDTTVEVEAPPDKIEDAVKHVLNALRSTPPAESVRRQPTKQVTCRAVIEDMVAEGWMKVERTLSEVAAELSRRGYNYDRTAIAHVLLDLVRLGLLERRGEPRRYAYVQTVPRGQESQSATLE
jgi:hypothetical protein